MAFLFTKYKCRKTVEENKLTTGEQAAAVDQSYYLDPRLQAGAIDFRNVY